jgi:TrpR-related protein YerC/YecD
MMRISERKVHTSLKSQIAKTFIQAIVDFKNPREAETFLSDFFTNSEFDTYAKRLAVAYWLKKGRSYTNIRENLKVSSATIASVQNTIDTPGIKLAIKKIEAEEWATQWSEKIKKVIGK